MAPSSTMSRRHEDERFTHEGTMTEPVELIDEHSTLIMRPTKEGS
jgi:hypothetical protein